MSNKPVQPPYNYKEGDEVQVKYRQEDGTIIWLDAKIMNVRERVIFLDIFDELPRTA